MADFRRLLLARGLPFVVMYAAAQWAYQHLRGSDTGLWLLEAATAAPAASLIGLVFPADGVHALGPRLAWPGGRLQLFAGCDGFEVMALYLPAVLVAPVAWRRTLVMLVGGIALIWALNQGRLLALYASFRYGREAFDAIHAVWAPLLLLSAVAAFFAWHLHAAARR